MADLIDTVVKTRNIAEEIAAQSLLNIDGISEIELYERILKAMSSHVEIFPRGWYDPPRDGISVLFDRAPFGRLLYDSLRNLEYAPSPTRLFEKESVGGIYFSPVNKTTKTLGDIGFTLYRGDNKEIKEHLRKSYAVVLQIAEHAEVGMSFSSLCKFASELFSANGLKPSRRAILSSDQNQSLNLGHSVPGASGNEVIEGDSFEEIKENIRTKRVHFINTEDFKIPETYAFTVESRLESATDSNMPSASWHFIVCFDKGKKIILNNFQEIFKVVEMDYMNIK